jgi:hypothetical protein
MMDNWNDDWPTHIRNKDEAQKRLHKAVCHVFFLIMDSNDEALPIEKVQELCHSIADVPIDAETSDPFDDEYHQILDTMEGLKADLQRHTPAPQDAGLLVAALSGSLDGQDDDAEALFPGSRARRGTKLS